MRHSQPFLKDTWNRLTGKDATQTNRYGQWYVEKAYVAAEVELCIGLVTAALIVIYDGNWWLALGTLVGFLILEFFVLMAISIAENVIEVRKQVEALVKARGVVEGLEPEAKEDDADPYKVLRIASISTLVTLLIVLARTLF